MTQEEKSRAYDEALKRAKQYSAKYKIMMEHIFPELKEDEENKKWTKWLIPHLKGYMNTTNEEYGEVCKKAIAWLEKQSEQKPVWSEEDERLQQCLISDQENCLEKVKNDKVGHSEIISDLKEMYRERIDWLKSLKERMKGGEE